MKLSPEGTELLKWVEKLRLHPYDDQTGKPISTWCKGATIGYGYLIPIREWDLYQNGITKEEAEALFDKTIKPFEDAVNSMVKPKLTQNEFDALVIFVYNLGIEQFSHSSLLKMMNNPGVYTPFKSIEKAWKAWNKSQGKVNNGLINRRNAEWKIYSLGIYEKW